MRRLAELNIFAKQGRTLSLKASIIGFFGILLVVSAVAGYWRADLLQAEFHQLAIARGFTPKTIEITGRNHTKKQ